MNSNDPSSAQAALALLRSLGAPQRLVMHGEIVSEVATHISCDLSKLGVEHDTALVVAGAALHDIGKIIYSEELYHPGREHEAAGERLLLDNGLSATLARVCRAHGKWDEAATSLEELLIAVADHLWKGTRCEQLEMLIIAEVSKRLLIDRWDAFLRLDPVFERIAAGGVERLARAKIQVELQAMDELEEGRQNGRVITARRGLFPAH